MKTNPTPTEIAKLLINPLVGWHKQTVYVTDGSILFTFPDREWMGEKLFNEEKSMWGILDAGEWTFGKDGRNRRALNPIPEVMIDFMASQGDPINFAAIPAQKERPEWLDPSKMTMVTCSECEGTGVVTCEYNHDHECPDCEGSGKVAKLAIEDWLKVDDLFLETLAGSYDRRYIWLLQKFEVTQAFKCKGIDYEALLVCGDGFKAKVMFGRKNR